MHFPVLNDLEYDKVCYYLIFYNKDTGYKFIYAKSNELFSQEVIEQSKKVSEENGWGQPLIVEIHEKKEILKEVLIE